MHQINPQILHGEDLSNMWVWEVDDEVEPIALFIVKPLRVTSTLCLYCYAMLGDVDWVSVSMTDVSIVN